MNYIPDPSKLRLWDSWVYITEDDTIHLFFLANAPGGAWGLAGHAVSRDWLHWQELPPIRLAGDEGEWDAGMVGTGMVFRYDDGRYYMTYTAGLTRQECHGLLVSDDLVNWEKVTRQGPVWPRSLRPPYESDEQRAAPADWRDAFVTRNPAGEWEAVCCGRVGRGPHAGRGCLGRCRIEAIDQWVELPPIADVGRYPAMEVPEIFAFAGRYWVIFSSTSGRGVRLATPERPIGAGTFFLSADRWQGPYRAAPDNLLIGAGFNKMSAYVARTVEYQGQRLVYHHYAGNPPAFGWPKVLNAEGEILYLTAWDGLEQLRESEIRLADWKPITHGPAAPGDWQVEGATVQGRCEYGASILRADTTATDVDIEADVIIRAGARAGLVTGLSNTPNQKGIALLLDIEAGEIALGEAYTWEHANGPNLSQIIDSVRRPLFHNRAYRVRLIHRHCYVEVYVDGRLVFSTVTDFVPSVGGVGCAIESANAEFVFRHAHRMEALRKPT
jgi:hypothetical protein